MFCFCVNIVVGVRVCVSAIVFHHCHLNQPECSEPLSTCDFVKTKSASDRHFRAYSSFSVQLLELNMRNYNSKREKSLTGLNCTHFLL